MNPIFDKIKNVLAGGTGQLIEKAGVLIDNLTMSKEEKEQFKIDLIKIQNERDLAVLNAAQAETDSYLKDTQSARDSNVKIQESSNASWLAKNIAYCIDGVFVIAFFVGLLLIYNKAVPETNKELFYTGFGALTSYVATILNFHRGTSIGSKQNGDTIRKMVDKV